VSDAFYINATIGVDSIDSPGLGGTKDFLTYDAYVMLLPEDRVRIALGTQRFTLDSEPTLRGRVIVDQVKAFTDFQPTERSRITLRTLHADYTDGNRQQWWQAEFEQRLALAPRLYVGARYTGTSFRLIDQPGYFSPGEYHAVEATLRLDGQAGPRIWYGLRASAGGERTVSSVDRFIVSGSAYLHQQIKPAIDIEAACDYSPKARRPQLALNAALPASA
jgi:hypothetical protein